MVRWARETLDWRPMPWQVWVLVHANEQLPNGDPRFTTRLILAGRQCGKTMLTVVNALYAVAHGTPLVLGTSTTISTAVEAWDIAVEMAEDRPEIFGKLKVRRSNGEWSMTAENRGRYRVASASRRGGRGLTIHKLYIDELREHQSWDAIAAATNATNAVPNAEIWLMSNQGDQSSVVLAHYRALAISGADPTLGFWEYSAPDDAEISDRDAWRQALPALGYTVTEAAIAAKLSQPASLFKIENLCMAVPALGEAVTSASWSACRDPGTLDAARSRVALCLDISPDLAHATLCAAATLPDGRVRVEVVRAWSSTSAVRAELPGLLDRIRPRAFGWYPLGPAAALAADLSKAKRLHGLSASETNQACQGLAEYAAAGRVAHNGDELLAAHILGAKRLNSGDGWRFSRRDGGHCDAAYAAAGAVHLARSLPPPPTLRLVSAPTDMSER